MDEKISSIASFYKDRSVLVTGATGLIGKVLVEKLLRSCPGINRIYLLLRSKKGFEPQQRLENLLKLKLFERVKSEQPNAIYKLIAIQGDMTSDALGLSPSDEKLITENVSVVFHSAASIALNAPLKRNFDTNILGTYRLVQLCRKMQELKAFVHVSTAYINFDADEVEEIIYPSSFPPRKLIDMFEWLDDDMANALTPYLLKGSTTTYTYTKSLTEAYLSECHDLPVTIVRPSIVSSTWKEPIPGWVDGYSIMRDIVLTEFKGMLRCIYCNDSLILDIIPVDVVVNLIVTTAWHVASHRPEGIMVYNCTSGSTNGVTCYTSKNCLISSIYQYPSKDLFRSPATFTAITDDISYYIFTMMFHTIPAYFYDFLFILSGQSPKLVRLYKKFQKAIDSAKPYTDRKWNFAHKNAFVLQEMLSPEDAKEFDFNIESLSWPSYFENMILGIRHIFLKEDPSTLPAARKKLRRLIFFEKVAKYIFITITLFLCVKIFFSLI